MTTTVDESDVELFPDGHQEESQEVVAPSTNHLDQEAGFSADTSEEDSTNKEELNWRQANSVMKQQSAMIQAQNQRLAQMEKELMKTRPSSEEELELGEDDLVSSSQVKKLVKIESEKIAHDLLEKEKIKKREATARQRYADYDHYMTDENVARLKVKHPEMAETIATLLENPDPRYDPYMMAYTIIKGSPELQAKPKNSKSLQKIEKNLDKPVSGQGMGRSQGIANAQTFASASKEELRREMREAMLS